MTQTLFTSPHIDRVAIALGPLQIRGYTLAYVAGLIGGWWILRRQIKAGLSVLSADQLDGLMNACLVGILVGGRLGYVLFYNPSAYLAAPMDVFKVWQGGMSFHGGFLGVLCAIYLLSRRASVPFLALGDAVAMAAPLGLFFGRIANFINAELYGRVTTSPLGIIFPGAGPDPRHPSQLYEALSEGILLFCVLFTAYQLKMRQPASQRRDGHIMALFAMGYGSARYLVEFVREPDAHIGLLINMPFFTLSMGQLLCLPMILAGAVLYISISRKHRNV